MENLFIKTLKEEHARFVTLRAAKETADRTMESETMVNSIMRRLERDFEPYDSESEYYIGFGCEYWDDEETYINDTFGDVIKDSKNTHAEWN